MIGNDQQLAAARSELTQLEARLREIDERDESLTSFQVQLEQTGVRKMISRIEEEVEAYESARSGCVPPILSARVSEGSFSEIASALVQLRVARGLRQEDLARLLEKRQPGIARWENGDYEGYTLKELCRLSAALGRELTISFVAAEADDQTEHPVAAAGVTS